MTEATVLYPIIAEAPMPGVAPNIFYQALGGLAQTAGNPDPIFFLGYRVVRREIESDVTLHTGAATENLLDVFPELEDLYQLRGSWATGAPVDVFKRAVVVLGLNGQTPFDVGQVCALFRIGSTEAIEVFCDAVKAIADGQKAGIEDGLDFLSDWIGKQENRWAGEAASAIEAHDLVVFNQPGA